MTGNNSTTRRNVLKGAGATGTVALTGLAGCTGSAPTDTPSDDSGSGSNDGDESTDSPSGQQSNLEVAHWWSAGDGNAAINALVDGFKEANPDVLIDENLVAGGAGDNLRDKIRTRIQNGDPPSTFQTWPGAELQPFVEADLLKDISESVWSKNGMKDAYLEGPKQAAKPGGTFVTVPLNIHRLNNLFYNTAVLEEAGVGDPSSIGSPSELVEAMAQVSDAGMIGMAQQTKSPWSTLQLWAQVLLGEHGMDTYMAFTEGKVEENEEAVKNSLQIVKDYRNHFNEDAGSISWTEANGYIIDGKAGFFHQGDWAAGAYRGADGFEYDSDWSQVPFPGTDGLYALNMDSFPFPVNNPTPEFTEKFLTYVGTVDAQERFNPKKGSIPPRTDVPDDKFGPFLTQQKADFADSSGQPPSITHGLGVLPETLSNLKGATKSFTTNWDVDKAYNGFVQAFQ